MYLRAAMSRLARRIPRRATKDLACMPFYELSFRFELTTAGMSKRRVVTIPEPPRRIALTIDFGRNEHLESPGDRRQAESTPIKRLVMNAA